MYGQQIVPTTTITTAATKTTTISLNDNSINEIWVTDVKSTDKRWHEFEISFVYSFGTKLNEWPFPSSNPLSAAHTKYKGNLTYSQKKHGLQFHENDYQTFGDIRAILQKMKTGNTHVHLKRHWIVCELHPSTQRDVVEFPFFFFFCTLTQKINLF